MRDNEKERNYEGENEETTNKNMLEYEEINNMNRRWINRKEEQEKRWKIVWKIWNLWNYFVGFMGFLILLHKNVNILVFWYIYEN